MFLSEIISQVRRGRTVRLVSSWITCHLFDDGFSVMNRMKTAGFEPFLPLYWTDKRDRSGERTKIAKTLYPGYIFVKFVEEWGKLFRLDGVAKVMGNERSPCFVPDQVVDDLRIGMQEGEGAIQLNDIPGNVELSVGAPVRITAGPHTGLFGLVYKDASKKGRALVKLFYLGQERIVSIPVHLLACP